MQSYCQKWRDYEFEHPTEEKDYLVFVQANEDYGNVDYIDVCFWNGEYFEGGGKTGIDDGLDPTYWMELPEPPPYKIKTEAVPVSKEQVEIAWQMILQAQEYAEMIADAFAPFLEQVMALFEDEQK